MHTSLTELQYVFGVHDLMHSYVSCVDRLKFQLINGLYFITAAFDALCESLGSPQFEASVGAKDNDVNFLSNFMNSTILQSLVQVSDFKYQWYITDHPCVN